MNKQGARELGQKAQELSKKGEFNQAIAYYRQAIELDASCYNYYYQLGNLLQQQGLITQATLYLEQAIELEANNSWAYYSLGKVLVQQDKISAAIDAYNKAIALNPDFFWSYYNLGRILHSQSQLDRAKDCYCKAIELNSEYSWVHHFLAELLSKQGEIDLAISHYNQAIELNPDFSNSYYELGKNLQQKLQYQAAIDCYFKVIELEPQHFLPYYYLGEMLASTGEINQAINYYQQTIELNPKYLPAYFSLGQILIARGQKAIADYRNSLKNKSKLWQVYFEIGLGQAWEKKSNFATAIDCYLNAIKLDPHQELAYKILQYVEITPEKLNEIIIFYQELTEKIPSLNLAWGNLGDLLTQENKLDKAIICYRNSCYYNAAKKNPELAKLNWTYKKQKAPNFIIIGAAKCGTSSLFSYLQQHPQILLPHKKEINFFNKYFNKGLDWYLAHFPAITDSEEFITGEATTKYIFTPEVNHRIYNTFADIKIIIMLRNPIDRTVSDYYHHVNRGLETRSLKTIMENTQELLNKCPVLELEYPINEFDYILRSIYFPQVCRWLENFSRDNILILNSDNFFRNTSSVMKDVWQFLQVSCDSSFTNIKYNVGNYMPLADDIREELDKIFAPYNGKLEEYLDIKFNW